MVVAGQELRDLWLGGRALLLTLALSLLLSVVSYLVATNQALNYLEQRESVNLTLQVAVAVGALLALLAAADTISGERERGTLESLLVTPVSRQGLTAGKLMAALSLWVGAFAVTAVNMTTHCGYRLPVYDWLFANSRCHDVHHSSREPRNISVMISICDRILGTFQQVR